MTVAIIGAGQAGARAVQALRTCGFDGRIVLIGEESHLPYDRPPLSKDILAGRQSVEAVRLLEPGFYADQSIELRLGLRATQIDRREKRVLLSDASSVAYDHLVLATGLRARPLRGFALGARLFHLRHLDDAYSLRDQLLPGRRVLVVGGGLLGLEIAATARQIGCSVTVVERNPSPLYRTVDALVGNHVIGLHHRHGVRILTGVTPKSMVLQSDAGSPQDIQIELSDGLTMTADLVIGATGSIVNTELAEACGLDVQDGVIVNEYGQTSDPDIFALGDISRHFNPLLGRAIRVESWHNAQNQPMAMARFLTGTPTPYAEVPWFWSDQFDMNLQIVGYPSEWDKVIVHGNAQGEKFTVLYLQGDRLVAANTINNGRDVRVAREWIAQRTPVDVEALAKGQLPTLQQAARSAA